MDSLLNRDIWSEISKYMYPFKWSDGTRNYSYQRKASVANSYVDGDTAVYYGYKSLIRARGHNMFFNRWREYIRHPSIVSLIHPYVRDSYISEKEKATMYAKAINSGVIDITKLEHPNSFLRQLINYCKDLQITVSFLEDLRKIGMLDNIDTLYNKIDKKTKEGKAAIKFLYDNGYLDTETSLAHHMFCLKMEKKCNWGVHLLIEDSKLVIKRGAEVEYNKVSYKSTMYANIRIVRILLRTMLNHMKYYIIRYTGRFYPYQYILVQIGLLDREFDCKMGETITLSQSFKGVSSMTDAQVEYCYNLLTILYYCINKCDIVVEKQYPGGLRICNSTISFAVLGPRLIHLDRFGLVPKFVDTIVKLPDPKIALFYSILYWSAEHPTSTLFASLLATVRNTPQYEDLISNIVYPIHNDRIRLYSLCRVSNSVFLHLKTHYNESGIITDDTFISCLPLDATVVL